MKVSSGLVTGSLVIGSLIVTSGCHLGQRADRDANHWQGHAGQVVSSIDHQSNPASATAGHYQLAGPSSAELAASAQLPPPPQTAQDCIKAWDVFESPHLRVLQSRALQSNPVGLLANVDVAFQGPYAHSRSVLKQVADAYINIRYNLERLQDSYEVLEIQEQAAQHARQRKADGKAGRMDVLQAESAIGLTKSQMVPINAEMRSSIVQLQGLTGSSISTAVLKGIVNSPQLSMPNLDRRLPATVLRQRFDVRSAEQQVVSMGVQAGIPEVAMLPHLSLQGELTAKHDPGGREAKNVHDSLDLDLGGAETWHFATQDAAGSTDMDGNGYSPIPDTMRSFQSTVYSAAGEVEQLLTQYHQALADTQNLERTLADAKEVARLAQQQFQVDRIEGSYVANAQSRRAEVGQALAHSRARLASIAVSLLVATGGDCYVDFDSAAVYGQ